MREVVRCGRCGARYDGRHDKCPRCRGKAPRPLESTGGRPPKFDVPWRAAGAGIVALAMMGVTWAWAVQPKAVVAAPTPEGTGPIAAIASARAVPIVTARNKVPVDLPFLEEAQVEGRLAYKRGEYEVALERFKEEISRNPANASALSNAGQVLVRMGRAPDALPFFEQAVALAPGQWTFRFNMARCRAELGQWALAVVEYEEAVRLFPNDHATMFNLAQALHRAGREEEAVARYRQAIQLKPDDPSFHLAMGISEEKRGRAEDAIAAYRLFAELAPGAKEVAGVVLRVQELEKTLAAAPAAPAAAPPPAAEPSR